MKKTYLSMLISAAVFLPVFSALEAQEAFTKPEFGFISEQPSRQWEHSMISGNGTMGVMAPGEPYAERILVSHAALYLPCKVSGERYLQGERLDEIRTLCLDGKYREAGEMIEQIKAKVGYTDDRDPYISGFNICIRQETGATSRYQRSVNYETGEAFTDWQNERGVFRRSVFVSRPDSVIVLRLTGNAPLNAVVSFEEVPVNNYYDQQKKDTYVKETLSLASLKLNLASQSTLADKWLSFRTLFKYENPYNTLRGYEGVGRVVNKGGSLVCAGNEIIVRDVDELLVLVRIEPLPENTETVMPVLQRYLGSLPVDYLVLQQPHAAVQGDLFGRVRLDLGAPAADRALPTEQLIARSQTGAPPLAMIEKAFNAGRYNIISCMGHNPPNLQGLWSGTWSAPWSGSFTTNGNLPTALAFVIPGNTPALMHAYFGHTARLMDGYRTSARELFNTRGFHIPAQMTTNWRVMDNSADFPHAFWTAGTAWTARWYFDYYEYTDDRVFLREQAYPLMQEAALFFEDFLTVERDGKYVFVPSFSPENSPSSTKVPACINATMDIAACKQLLRNCITAATALGTDKDKITTWKALLAKIPDYDVSPEGALREWLWPGLDEAYMHRHASHLYGLYDELPIEFKQNPPLLKAAEKAIDYRIKFFKEQGGGMAFGICNAGWAAAHIGNRRQTAEITDFMTRSYWSSGMASFHDVQNLFNIDVSGGYPYLISQCLTLSEPGYLKLLPARPDRWTKGRIEGLLLRGNITLQQLAWDEKTVTATLLSPKNGAIRVEYNGRTQRVKLMKDKPVKVIFEVRSKSEK
jgi:hypothetical protein